MSTENICGVPLDHRCRKPPTLNSLRPLEQPRSTYPPASHNSDSPGPSGRRDVQRSKVSGVTIGSIPVKALRFSLLALRARRRR